MKRNKRKVEHQIALGFLKNGREVVEVIVGKHKGELGEIYDADDRNVLVRLLRNNEEIELKSEHIKNYKIYPDTLNEHFMELEQHEKFNELTSKYGYNRGVLIYHGTLVEEALAYSDEDAEAAVEAMSSFI